MGSLLSQRIELGQPTVANHTNLSISDVLPILSNAPSRNKAGMTKLDLTFLSFIVLMVLQRMKMQQRMSMRPKMLQHHAVALNEEVVCDMAMKKENYHPKEDFYHLIGSISIT